MRRLIIKKEITSIVFIIMLFVLAGINLYHTLPYLKNVDVSKVENLNNVRTLVSNYESTITENIFGRYSFIEGYGLWNLVLNKKEINGFSHIKDDNGYLHYSDFWNMENNDIDLIVNQILVLEDKVSKYNTEVVIIMPPSKDHDSYVSYQPGMPYPDKNWAADKYMSILESNGIKTIDFRNILLKSGMKYGEMYYVTDHHWTTKAVFYCYTEFVKIMNNWYNLSLDSKGIMTDENNYNILEYRNSNLGSHGRGTGIVYAGGLDDFTLMYPKYPTNMSYTWGVQNAQSVLNGRFEDTVVSTYNIINSNIYTQDKYAAYLNGIADWDKIKNNLNKAGKKVLFLRDSCSSPFAAFASQLFYETDLVWTLKLNFDLEEKFNLEEYDYIFISLYPDNLKENMFRFVQEK